MSEPIKETLKNILNNVNENVVAIILSVLTSIIIIGFGIYFYHIFNLQRRKCSQLESKNPNRNTVIQTVVPQEYRLRDYHIKTAYNCCSLGAYKNDYVGICALKNVLIQGVRGLDFEIFSINDAPVIATSVSNSTDSKDTFNYVSFEEALMFITQTAFNGFMVNNSGDPIILHLRFKSNNMKMYDKLVSILSNYQSYFVDRQYNNINLGSIPLKYLMKKISIAVNDSNKTYRDCSEFMEYVNVISGAENMRMITFQDVKTGDANQYADLVKYNQKYLTICIPDKEESLQNPNITYFRDTGCNMIALKYQTTDVFMDKNNELFKNNAFVLKPSSLIKKTGNTSDVMITTIPNVRVPFQRPVFNPNNKERNNRGGDNKNNRGDERNEKNNKGGERNEKNNRGGEKNEKNNRGGERNEKNNRGGDEKQQRVNKNNNLRGRQQDNSNPSR